jgi:hypothetical protein
MVTEWEAVVTKFTELTPHLLYGTSSWRRASHRTTLPGKPLRIVVISTIGTFYQWFHDEEATSSKFWGLGPFHWDIMNEGYRLRTSRTPIGKVRKANGRLVKIDSCNYNMHMASCILSLEPQYKSKLTATPLVNGIEDLRWIVRFVESSSWLTLQVPPDTVNYTLNNDDDWIADGSNVPGTERGAGYTPPADRYKKGPELGSLVHCTTIDWDACMLTIMGEVGKLTNAVQTSDIVIRLQRYKETIRR